MKNKDVKALKRFEPESEQSGDKAEAIVRTVPPPLALTQRLGHRAAIQASEIRYRRLFEAARDGILILDPGTRKITDANPFMSELLGYPREELLGKELWEIGLLQDEAASRVAFRELQKKHFIRYEDLPLQAKAGERQEVEFVSNLYDEDGRKVIQCNIRDITERKHAEAELRRLPQHIIEAQETERQFVAHELNESVNQIIASAIMRLLQLEENVTRRSPASGKILERCAHLLTDALEANRRIAHDLWPSELEHLGWIAACHDFCRQFHVRTGIEVKSRIARFIGRLPPEMELSLYRIMQEAFHNAEKHARTAEILIRLTFRQNSLVMQIQDKGIGFDAKQVRRRGLTSIQEHVGLLGGICAIKSSPGNGTSITVSVPRPAQEMVLSAIARIGRTMHPAGRLRYDERGGDTDHPSCGEAGSGFQQRGNKLGTSDCFMPGKRKSTTLMRCGAALAQEERG